jgi:hypothetical protein
MQRHHGCLDIEQAQSAALHGRVLVVSISRNRFCRITLVGVGDKSTPQMIMYFVGLAVWRTPLSQKHTSLMPSILITEM